MKLNLLSALCQGAVLRTVREFTHVITLGQWVLLGLSSVPGRGSEALSGEMAQLSTQSGSTTYTLIHYSVSSSTREPPDSCMKGTG